MKPSIQFKQTPTFLTVLALLYSGILPVAQAVFPPPDGGYPGGNTAEGENALVSLTSGTLNTAVGLGSLASDTTASLNTGVGAATLVLNTANENTATGAGALLLNTSGAANTANGALALLNNDTGSSNTAVGDQALFATTTGSFNTATGSFALTSNSIGSDNTAIGAGALENNTGSGNTAVGSAALLFNTIGEGNTATGAQALANNMSALNTADGFQALQNNTTGSSNTAVGFHALHSNTDGISNTAVGDSALFQSTGGLNIAIGWSAGVNVTTGEGNIEIGNGGVFDDEHTIRIGGIGNQTRTFIRGIRDVTTGNNNAIPVVIDSAHQLGTMSSSRRFKKEIKSMNKASEAILALKPVTFHYKSDDTNRPEFGLIAEEVAEVNPALVVRDENGKVYTVRYDAVNAMLLNEFIKEHRTVQKQQKQIDTLRAELKEQRKLVQRVNEKVELNRARSQLADNRH